MGKAAHRSRIKRQKFFSGLAKTNLQGFEAEWERRLESWLYEIGLAINEWKGGGDAAKERIFCIVDTAMDILTGCGPEIYGKYAENTYSILSNECSAGVAGIIDRRLYKLSNFDSYKYKSKKGRGPYGLEAYVP